MFDSNEGFAVWTTRITILLLLVLSVIVLNSIAPYLFPLYYLYVVIGVALYFIFSKIAVNILAVFYKHFYILTTVFLIVPLLINQVTRGAVRWIPIGALTIQPAEIIRPFLFIFFAVFFSKNKKNFKTFYQSVLLLALPVFLILIQPSLGVAIITTIGYIGLFMASGFNKKTILITILGMFLVIPLLWLILAPYQKLRILTFLDPFKDPYGAGYNSIQSMIAVGAGGIWGRGLGNGVQTQLSFLPERQTDFIFASVAEELGIVGAMLLVMGLFYLLFQLAKSMEYAANPTARIFTFGVFLVLFTQTVVNIGMNLGILPITGLPLPLVSAGGSSLLGTMILLGIVEGARK